MSVLNRTLAWLGLAPIERVRLEARNTRSYPPMSPATADRLRDHFEPHNAALEALIGEPMNW